MRYVAARLEIESRDLAYRIYITEGIKALANINMSYTDLIARSKKVKENRTPEEIIGNIKNGLSKIGG